MTDGGFDGTRLDEWLQTVERRHPGWDLGLERVAAVGQRLGVLECAERILLVAGTNGKGSTCEYLTRLALEAGLKVGTSTSPHFHRFNERIRVDGRPVSDGRIIDAFRSIETARREISLSQFEFIALASLIVFKEEMSDMAVLEIGLGGRLDAMNIVDPDVSVITSIAMDHERWLGNDRETIAVEKAGIMRADVPCVYADPMPAESIVREASARNAPLRLMGRDFDMKGTTLTYSDGGGCRSVELPEQPGLPEESFAAAVQAMAEAGLGFDAATLSAVAENTTLTGRGQVITLHCPVMFDVAHNPAAASRLARQVIRKLPAGEVHAVFGIYRDKDIAGVALPLANLVKTWRLADMDEARAAPATEVQRILRGIPTGRSYTYGRIADAVKAALDACTADDLLIVFGSFPVVAGALEETDNYHQGLG